MATLFDVDEPEVWRGLTLWEPYASLTASGVKTVETRSWGTPYRGTLLIHAAKKADEERIAEMRWAADVMEGHPEWLPAEGTEHWIAANRVYAETVGKVLAVANLVRCVRSRNKADWSDANQTFGDLSPGRWGWCLSDVRPLPKPIPWQGSQGLWLVPDELRERVLEQLGAARREE